MTFYIQKIKDQPHCDTHKNVFLAYIKHHNSQGDIVIIFHIWSDTELVTLILKL